ncbi:hypothetical protein RN001_010622 [Aquatica leii]|uniref:Uncharacterized protein n=1 Tax=Aquatica leii TaxID=1421715 RepID=A0AAN7S8M9_9COLE|nr:hypothetical protein RN001_010622 [Aquatica leii]
MEKDEVNGFSRNDQSTYGSIPTSSTQKSKRIVYYVVGKPSVGLLPVFQGQIIAVDSDSDVTQSSKDKACTKKVYDAHCQKYRSKKFDEAAWNKLVLASALCFTFMVLEGLGGYFSRSLAIATDAAHLLADFASYIISLFAVWLATRSASKKMPFGWNRVEVLGALVSILLIWVVTGELVYLAAMRLIKKEFEIDAKIMLITSMFGVLINFIIGFTLHAHGHDHGVYADENINVRAAFIHVIGDILQSIGVCIAAIVIFIRPDLSIIDPICTFIFSVLVLFSTCNILKDSLLVLMNRLPKSINYNEVMEEFINIEGVRKVYNMKMWALTPEKIALAVHVISNPGVNPQDILEAASKKIHKKYNFFEMTLQIEQVGDSTEYEEKEMSVD